MNPYPTYHEYRQKPDATTWHYIANTPSTHVRATSMTEQGPVSYDWSHTNVHYTTNHTNANMSPLNAFAGALQQQQHYQPSRQQPRQLPPPTQRQQRPLDHGKPPSPFFIDRGNGQYTRLIPADMLPDLVEVPKREGPEVEGTRLPGYECGNKMLTLKSGRDPVQSRIDTLTSSSARPHKREKIYCDKWVHEGICSFAQQGCRYLHVMPEDKTTQQLLGLYQGYPPWWRKKLEQDAMAASAQANRVDGMATSAHVRGPGGGVPGMNSAHCHDTNRGHVKIGSMIDGQGWVDEMTNPQNYGSARDPGSTRIFESSGMTTPNESSSSRDGDVFGLTSPSNSSIMNRRSLGASSYGPIQRPPWASMN